MAPEQEVAISEPAAWQRRTQATSASKRPSSGPWATIMSSGTQTTAGAVTSSKPQLRLDRHAVGRAHDAGAARLTSTGSSSAGPGSPLTTIGQSRPAHFRRSNMP